MCLDLLYLDDLTWQESDGPALSDNLISPFTVLVKCLDGSYDIPIASIAMLGQSV